MTHLIDFLVCDDIRHEKSGKITLVGTYPDGISIGLTKRPEGLVVIPKIGLFARVMFDEDQPLPNSFQIRCLMGDRELFSFSGAMEVKNPKRPVTVPLVTEAPTPVSSGELEFELVFLRGEEVVATLRPGMTPIVVENMFTLQA